jgi:hypothetical protein
MSINREIRYVTSGDKNSRSQAFYNNYWSDSRPVQTSYFLFTKPQFYTYGGTLNYYSQDPYAIFTNLVKPPIRFVFSANTFSLSGDSYFIHDIYRLDYDTYKLFSDNQIGNSQEIKNTLFGNNIPRPNDAPPLNNILSRELVSGNSTRKGNNPIPQPEKFPGNPLTTSDAATIQGILGNPILTITASTSGITGNVYDLYLDQYIKQKGFYKTELFIDRAQYFINTRIVFNVNLGKNYDGYSKLDSGFGFNSINTTWNNQLQLSATNSVAHSIESGPFAGMQVIGNFFAYFNVPDKPKLEYPIMSGQLTTFTPEFRWSNGDRADSFLIQVSYNTGDTNFTGTVFNYPVEKHEKNSQIMRSTTQGSTEELATDKNIYTFQLPVKSNKSFIYRIGNSKEIIDVFDVRRNVITFSDYYLAISQSEPIRTYVRTESDSRYVTEIAGLGVPPSLDYESEVAEFILSGVVSGSTVTGATMQLTYPNSSFVTTTTDLTGAYSFSGLETGVYTLTTNYRGYQQDVRIINISSDTTLNFKLKILWSDDVDTWGKMAGESYYT